jgi:ABC-type transport system involved in cytochrome c biogenesis permease component
MTFLPIVAREMRVSARKGSTYWVRFAAAALALAVGGYTLFFLQFAGISNFAGQMLFGGLVGLIWIYACLGGVFKTADTLSEEKREGTLGLLFLTDLKGHDIVLGKMMAASVNWISGLLALFPILALSLLMGGVAPGEFWRKILGLTNLLFFSLALGMFVSSFTRHERRSAGITLGLLLLLMFAPNFLREVYQEWRGPAKAPTWLLVWDVKRPMQCASDVLFRRDASDYWISLGFTHAVGWVFLLLASLIVPRAWQQPAGRMSRLQENAGQISYGRNRERRKQFRQRALDLNPFFWVAHRARGKATVVSLSVIAIMAGFCISFLVDPGDWRSPWAFIWPAFWLHSLIKVWLTFEACRRFVEDRRSGALELILSTPMTPEKIVGGQWQALRHQFGFAVAAILLFDLVLTVSGVTVPQWVATAGSVDAKSKLIFVAMMAAGVVVFVLDLLALGWLSMWRGMNARHSYTAFLWSAVQLLLAPWILFYVSMTVFLMMFFLPRAVRGVAPGNNVLEWLPIILTGIWFGVSVAAAAFSIQWARTRLHRDFRYRATASYQPARTSVPRPAQSGALPPRLA